MTDLDIAHGIAAWPEDTNEGRAFRELRDLREAARPFLEADRKITSMSTGPKDPIGIVLYVTIEAVQRLREAVESEQERK
jgi:hypothetical protein